MQSPNFLIRTKEEITCGITNIPLSKPAKVYLDTINDNTSLVYSLFESLKIPFSRKDNNYTGQSTFSSDNYLESNTVKLIWRNFKSLHPKFITEYRYLFWEIDSQDTLLITEVMDMYKFLNLPVYVHKTMRGYHFISVKPIKDILWQEAVRALRKTNISYPPITLRINPNKYINEEKVFYDGFLYMPKIHKDTEQIRNYILGKKFDLIGQKYQLVYYHIDKVESDQYI